MAFGRSNSLSLNTGAANSLFSQQNNQSSQPPPAGGLFGSSTQTSQAGGGLFGTSTQTNQPQQSGGLFGSSTTQQNAGGGGLFGSSTQQNSNTGGGGLFGNAANQQQQSNTGGMFGQSTSQPQQSGSLFGGSLFGNTQNKSGGLFGASTNTAANTGGSSLFGGNNQQNAGGSSLFGRPNPNATQAQQQSIFGLSASQPTYTQPSLLGASQYRVGSRTTPFAGKLSMGQSAAPQPPAASSSKYGYDGMRPTTRFTELVDDVQNQLEAIDKMIQLQEKFCRDIEGFVPKHGDNVEGLGRDVEYIREKVEAAEQSLGIDAQGVQAQQSVLATDRKDFDRCQRVVDMLRYPQQYHYTGLNYGGSMRGLPSSSTLDPFDTEKKDMEILGNYFNPLATSLKSTLDAYAANLTEIEQHMRVIEHSTQVQGQQMVARRAGAGGQQGGTEETVRELAETLRGFEESILNAAALVGNCREGVNEVIMGRAGNSGRESRGRGW